jgi:hypothetical protein
VVVETDASSSSAPTTEAAEVQVAHAEVRLEQARGSRADQVLDRAIRLIDLLADRHERLEKLTAERLERTERALLEGTAQIRDALVAKARAEARLIEQHIESEAAATEAGGPLDELAGRALERLLPTPKTPD